MSEKEDILKLNPGDKVVLEVKDAHEDAEEWTGSGSVLGKLEDFQPKEEKIVMTPEEKAEFDKLKAVHKSLFWALIDITDVGYPHLFKRISYNDDAEENNKVQLEFAKAWDKPSRIKVVKEKYRIKLADGYLVNVMGDWLTLKNKKDGDIFIQSEIDILQKQEQFKAIDLNKCKEEVEDE